MRLSSMDYSRDPLKNSLHALHRFIRTAAWIAVVFSVLSILAANANHNDDPFLDGDPVVVNLGSRSCVKHFEGGNEMGRTFWACEIKPGDPGESSKH
jgi:hypothetical protein